MTSPIAPIGATEALAASPESVAPGQRGAFADMLSKGVDAVNQKLVDADALTRAFALDDNAVPVHQVTYALAQARLSLELLMQVRTQLLGAYQEFERMQV